MRVKQFANFVIVKMNLFFKNTKFYFKYNNITNEFFLKKFIIYPN